LSGPGPADPPLAGLRVLELATLYAGPQVGAMLGDLGADVVKVEPPGGDPMRGMGVVRDGVSRNWSWVARHKRSIVLDLEADADRQTFHALVGAADVLVENLTPGIRDRWGCRYEQLAAINPALVVVAVSCYGKGGPYADRPGAGTLAEAFGGLAALTGEPDGPPTLASVPLGDTLTAFWGVIGALAASWARQRGSPGRLVDVAMYEPVLAVLGGTIAGYDPADPPVRSGSRVRGGVPRNVYRTRDDEYVAVSGTTDPQVSRLLALLGRDGPEDQDRFGRARRPAGSRRRARPPRRRLRRRARPRRGAGRAARRPHPGRPRQRRRSDPRGPAPAGPGQPGPDARRGRTRARRGPGRGAARLAGVIQPSSLPTMPTKLTISPG
jgi:crotonobetainyl-CoA:carnitine CoA-transferase CaiB-like acyl-CoA transferase